MKQNKIFFKILILLTTITLLSIPSKAIIEKTKTINNTNQIKIGEIKINRPQVKAKGEGKEVYTTDIAITLPTKINIPGWGEFELPDWLAGQEITIKDVTWREKIEKVNSSFEVYIDYQGNAPELLITDLAVMLIYDLDLELSLQEIIKILNGNYSYIIDQLKNPTLASYTFNQVNDKWTKYIDMSNKHIFRDTYVIIGLYIDLLSQKLYRDAEIITFQTIKIKAFNHQQTNMVKPIQNLLKCNLPFLIKTNYIKLLSSIISAVQRATLPETLVHLST